MRTRTGLLAAMSMLLLAAPVSAQSADPLGVPQTLCVTVTTPAVDFAPLLPGATLPSGLEVTVVDYAECIPEPTGTSYDDFSIFQEEAIDELDAILDSGDEDAGIDDPSMRTWWVDIRQWGTSTTNAMKGLDPQECYRTEFDALAAVAKATTAAGKTMVKAVDQYADGDYSKALKTIKSGGKLVDAMIESRTTLDETYDRDACDLLDPEA